MELKLEVYTPALELVGVLEIQRSVIWAEKAFSAGSFSLESIIAEESRALLVPENILWIAGDTAGIIEHVEQQAGAEGPYITVKGRDLTGLLDRRILWGQYDLSGTPAAIMHKLVEDSAIAPTRGDVKARKLPGLVSLAAPVGGQSIRVQKTGGTLLEALEQLGETYQVAFGVRFNAAVPCMEFWTRPGADRSVDQNANEPVFYSTELDDVMESEYSYDSSKYRNVSLVAGEGEGGQRVMVTVETAVEPEPQPPIPPEPGKTYIITLAVDPEGGGVASGGGTVSEGDSVTVTATPAEGYVFSGWREGTEIVSTQAIYTFQASADRSLTAVFAAIIPTYTISVSVGADQEDWGTVTGGGQYQEGSSVTVTATPNEGYQFVGWQENGQQVSTNANYSFTVSGDVVLLAVFSEVVVGFDWKQTTLPSDGAWYSIAYGNEKFVSVRSNSNEVAHSTDGITWTAATLPASKYWRAIIYGYDKFVAVPNAYSYGAYSTDGVNWKSTYLSKSANWCSIAYGNSKFVAVSSNTNTFIYSSNGISWNNAIFSGSYFASAIVYGDNKFVICPRSGDQFSYSTNGTSWLRYKVPFSASWTSIAYGNDKFVAIASSTDKFIYSMDGISWTEAMFPFSASWCSITYGNGKFIAVANNSNKAVYSEDGINWMETILPSSSRWFGITYGDGKFVATTDNSDIAAYAES
jgi:hypothetical protein